MRLFVSHFKVRHCTFCIINISNYLLVKIIKFDFLNIFNKTNQTRPCNYVFSYISKKELEDFVFLLIVSKLKMRNQLKIDRALVKRYRETVKIVYCQKLDGTPNISVLLVPQFHRYTLTI